MVLNPYDSEVKAMQNLVPAISRLLTHLVSYKKNVRKETGDTSAVTVMWLYMLFRVLRFITQSRTSDILGTTETKLNH